MGCLACLASGAKAIIRPILMSDVIQEIGIAIANAFTANSYPLTRIRVNSQVVRTEPARLAMQVGQQLKNFSLNR